MESRPVFGQRDALPAAAGLTPLPAALMMSEPSRPHVLEQITGVSNTLLGFKGRLGRGPFCIVYLAAVAVWWTLTLSAVLSHPSSALRPLYTVANFTLLWVFIALAVKRWHDRGRSGAWALLAFVPVIGWMWSFVELGLLEGETGDNLYGPSTRRE